MTVALALHNANAPGMAGLFSMATRARLVTNWPHAGMVVDGVLMHATLANGLHATAFTGGSGWDLIELPEQIAPQVLDAFARHKGAKYDAVSLLAFLLPWRVSDSRRVYCYEWCWLAMMGENPHWRVTPELLLYGAHMLNAKEGAGR